MLLSARDGIDRFFQSRRDDMIMIMIDIQKICVKPLNMSVNNPPYRPYNPQGFTDLKVMLRHCMSCQLSIKKANQVTAEWFSDEYSVVFCWYSWIFLPLVLSRCSCIPYVLWWNNDGGGLIGSMRFLNTIGSEKFWSLKESDSTRNNINQGVL